MKDRSKFQFLIMMNIGAKQIPFSFYYQNQLPYSARLNQLNSQPQERRNRQAARRSRRHQLQHQKLPTHRAVHDIRSHRIPLYCYSSYHKLRWWWWLCCRIAKQSPRTAQTVSIMNRNNLQFVSIRKLTLQF